MGIIGLFSLVLIVTVFFYGLQGSDFLASQKSQGSIDTTNGGVVSSPSTPPSGQYNAYAASYSWDGILEETFLYQVSGSDNFSMLYRNFNEPLETTSVPNPHIEVLSIDGPDGTIAYIKDNMGTVSFPHGEQVVNVIQKIEAQSQKNEVGVYRSGGFDPGVFSVIYNFKFYPTIEYDQSAIHLNIKLLAQNAHPAYERITIIVPENPVKEIYFSPSHLIVKKNNNQIIATGRVAENEDIGFEVILEKDTLETLPGFPLYTDNVIKKTESAYTNQAPFIP
jgi:hypothetical protein